MDKNPFLKRLMDEETADVVHSSAYAKAQNAEGMGAASVQSFAARQALEQNRTAVRGYRDSKLMTEMGSGVITAKKFDASKDASQRAAIRNMVGSSRGGGHAGGDAADEGAGSAGGARGTSGTSIAGGGGRSPLSAPPARRNPGISR